MELENPIVDILCAEEKPPDWLIPELLLQGAMVCLAGEPGTGKSYISYTLGLAVASGCKALSGIVPKGDPRRVLYFDEENSIQDRDKYLRRSWQGLTATNHGKEPDLGLLIDNFWPLHMVLGTDNWKDTAAMAIEQVQPHLIVFDTATPAFNIQDENDNAEATQAIKGIRELMKLTDPPATAVVLKHAKMRTEKGGRRTMRGAKAWQGAADGVMFQVMATGRPRKDGLRLTRLEPDKTRAYGLRQTIYITPSWLDDKRNGLKLDASYSADKEHKKAEDEEDDDLD